MKIANLDGRLAVITDGGAVDVAKASDGRFGPDPQSVYEDWAAFRAWAAAADLSAAARWAEDALGSPAPRPAQVFAIGLNYQEHAAESRFDAPDTTPPVFTKFPTSITGPRSTVTLPSKGVDWEVELVAVVGRRAEHVAAADAWDHVAGLTVGQDLSERAVQLSGPAPQFSLGKSFPGFAPMGPVLVTPDDLPDPDDLALSCSLGEEVLQSSRTRNMIFSVPVLVEKLSAVCPLLPGDVIFTGTPSGVGVARDPKRFLSAGDTLVSEIEGIGRLRNPLVAGPEYDAE